ncbi:MAG: oligosaccharide flippase family protein [Thermoleophilaceae bacterium]
MTDVPEQVGPRFGGRFEEEGPGLRERTAKGTLINAAFMVGLASLGFVRGFGVAVFLTAEEYGIWGILAVVLGGVTTLKQVGISDKYIQQDDADQERAFQKAFTIDTLTNGILLVVLIAVTPLMAFAYGRPEIIVPGLVLTLGLPVASLQAPIWIYYRRMRFFQQRVLASVAPVVSFVVTIAMAAAGTGYWSLVVGTVAGVWAGGLVAALYSPYKLRFRYDRGTLREYVAFSWPLFVAVVTSLVVAQTSIFFGELTLGLAGAGAIALASSIALYTHRVDQIVTQSLYPAICAVKDRTDLLFESFVKSNRLALMWGMPFGVALTVFASDLVDFVLGEKWTLAVGLIQAFGLIAAFNHIGFNWTAFYRAIGNTRPMAVDSVVQTVLFLMAALPLLIVAGLDAFGIGMAVSAAGGLVVRTIYLMKLFPGFAMFRHTLRAILPTVPAVAVVLAARALESGERGAGHAAAELTVYLAVTIVATLMFERALLREMVGYLRGVRPAPI